MPEVSLRIPQIGEGLQEARLVAVLKQPGDTVKRDEAIYQMETDKAVMDVESPHEGRVVKWLADPDTVLKIGAEVMVMDVAGAAPTDSSETSVPGAEARQEGAANEVALKIPQIGEGLQEARLVSVLKEPGEKVARDEALYQMETDKAVMDVESPMAGTVVRWLAEPDTMLKIGADVVVLATEGGAAQAAAAKPAATTAAAPAAAPKATETGGQRRRDVPPRTRTYAKEKGVSDADLAGIPAAGGRLMPADIDAWLKGAGPASKTAVSASGKSFEEKAVPQKQRVLASRLQRGNQLVVPGMMSVVANWGGIEEVRAEIKRGGGDFQPSAFTMFAYCVAKAAGENPIVRTTLVGDDTFRTYHHIQLGIAVALPGDELVVAVVEDADKLSWREFATQAREKIDLARTGKDQANETVTLSITNMSGHQIREAMAVVVPPGAATIFLGEAYNGLSNETPGEFKVQRCANVGITIDHRIMNGVGGADVLLSIKRHVENIRELVTP
ncbi:MAG: 2-oxo acid dehydrogenase subunit E2 [Fimbriimonadaceae bacterium]|nr:2-oxo acid dehydrogenase subunit E2 [Fimbriimonadaceae bacterium]QYK56203.1 MAG: 2-oxo acid dehydrogenase subunit E2 [Fimbriimonadaceae bacterium]